MFRLFFFFFFKFEGFSKNFCRLEPSSGENVKYVFGGVIGFSLFAKNKTKSQFLSPVLPTKQSTKQSEIEMRAPCRAEINVKSPVLSISLARFAFGMIILQRWA